jgi:fatty-acyl-CoA synthase
MPLRFATPAKEAYDFPLTIRHLLDAALICAPDQEIVYRDQIRLTYRELRARIGRLATTLTGLGAGPGTTVAVMDWDSHRYLECYFAVPMMGAVLETVNVRLPAAQIAYTLMHAKAEILLVHRDFFAMIKELLPSLPGIKAVVAIADGTDEPIPAYSAGEYEALSAAASPDFPFEDFDENAIATTFYTTGTTGKPKGVCFSHRQIVLLALVAKAPFGVTQTPGLGFEAVYMPLTPMFHVHAWGLPYTATMLGVKQVYPGRYDPDMILDLRAREGVTYSHCVPTILQMVLTAAERRGADLSGWVMKIGGAAMTTALWRAGRRLGMELVSGYGMSETAPTVAVARRAPGTLGDEDAEMTALTMSGVPVPLVSARVVDQDLRGVPHDGVSRGELVLRAPWLTLCYEGDAAASADLWRGGWLHTQDIATIDPQGNIVIRDRLKDVIKTGGEWIGSLDVEELISAVDGVAEVAVIGVPDDRWGERPIAVVVAAPGHQPTLAAMNLPITAAIKRQEISRYAKLDAIEIVDELPRTSVGKIDKKLLRARFGGATSPALVPASRES